MNWTWQYVGLTLYVLSAVATMAVLAYDLSLDLRGYPTISEYCRANPWAAWVILMAIQGGVAGLAVHLMTGTAPRDKGAVMKTIWVTAILQGGAMMGARLSLPCRPADHAGEDRRSPAAGAHFLGQRSRERSSLV